VEFSLLWAVLTAAAGTWIGLRLWPQRLPDNAVDRLIAATLTGLVVGRLAAMSSQGINPLTNPAELIVIRGGVSTVAASIAFIASLVWTTRRSPGAADAMAPAVLLGLAFWHAGCLWRDACLGAPSVLPWAWAQDGSLVTRHPVELYAAIGLVLGAIVVGRLGWRSWLRAGAALGIAAGIRLLTEPLRPSLGGGPSLWYLSALTLGILLAVFGDRLDEKARTTLT
jgi:prolipoprotein diacylglyceryltransferase